MPMRIACLTSSLGCDAAVCVVGNIGGCLAYSCWSGTCGFRRLSYLVPVYGRLTHIPYYTLYTVRLHDAAGNSRAERSRQATATRVIMQGYCRPDIKTSKLVKANISVSELSANGTEFFACSSVSLKTLPLGACVVGIKTAK